jgi:hypothetical protein
LTAAWRMVHTNPIFSVVVSRETKSPTRFSNGWFKSQNGKSLPGEIEHGLTGGKNVPQS